MSFMRKAAIMVIAIAFFLLASPLVTGSSVFAAGPVKLIGYSHFQWEKSGFPNDTVPAGTTYLEIQRAAGDGRANDTDLNNAHIAGFSDYREYTGQPWKPAVRVYLHKGAGDVSSGYLTLNRDYTISYQNNTNAGTAKVIVKGIGNYTGTVVDTFKIDSVKCDVDNITSFQRKVKTYSNGSVQKPSAVVRAYGRTLVQGRDYTMTCYNNKNKCYGQAHFRFQGNYANYGSCYMGYAIQPDKPIVKVKFVKLKGSYTGFNIRTKNKVKVSELQLKIYKDKKCKKAVKGTSKWKGEKGKSFHVKKKTKLKKGKTYYLRIRTGYGYHDLGPEASNSNSKLIVADVLWSPWSKPIKFKAK